MPFSTRFSVLLSAVLFTGFTACEYNHLEVYEEQIKSMLLVLTPENGGDRVVLSFLDNDGLGGQRGIGKQRHTFRKHHLLCSALFATNGIN
ncbi:hypothetical protein OAE48_03440 [Flavobacteriales bacterium]|nr:hypothetical protein [Flavobacteriales bacterium]